MVLSTTLTSEEIDRELRNAGSYEGMKVTSVETIETHISYVYLVGDYAFKVKKPIKTSFLDYSTLPLRKEACEAELELDQRYARDLYIGVEPIVIRQDGRIQVGGEGDVVEYAVKMHRFPQDALLKTQVQNGQISDEDIVALAKNIATFHRSATACDRSEPHALPDQLLKDAVDNLDAIESSLSGDDLKMVHVLRTWTQEYFVEHIQDFQSRYRNGFIRECHGDLHLGNIVRWKDQFVPFDGIEFNDDYRCIDTMSDAAFLAMDFAARGQLDFGRSFINAYLDAAGDHATLAVLRWYMVYRALVRAKVAAMRINQSPQAEAAPFAQELHEYIQLAYRFSLRQEPMLWITHGVSGSGKTWASERVVRQHGAIRLRSDVERKRHMGMQPTERPDDRESEKLYCEFTNHATYLRLQQLTKRVVNAGYPVVIDAAFLKHADRDAFRQLAIELGATFRIIHCDASEQTLRQRIVSRLAEGKDASDADLEVLEMQLQSQEPLSAAESTFVVDTNDSDFFVVSESVREANHHGD